MLSTTNNCAGAVSLALRAGLADMFAPAPIDSLVSLIALTPNWIAHWAQQVADGIEAMNKATAALSHLVEQHGTRLPRGIPGAIPSNAAWLTASAISGKLRDSLVKAIDTALAAYNQSPFTGDLNPDQHRRLYKLVEALCHYTARQPNGDRIKAVLHLAESVLTRLNFVNNRVGDVLSLT